MSDTKSVQHEVRSPLIYISHMAKPPKFTPYTWQDQKNLLAAGERGKAQMDGLKGFAMAMGLVVGVLAWFALLVYVLADLFF